MPAIRRILVEEEAAAYETSQRILNRLRGIPVEVIPERGVLRATDRRPAAWLAEAKSTLLLAVQKGPFWRPCPGTKGYICCGYQVLQTALNCPLDCTYCILQGYVNLPALTIFVNQEDLIAELRGRWAQNPQQVWRLGTGEFNDSLALDELSGLHERLLPLFAENRCAILEIKSKWSRLEHLLSLGPNSQVIFAWSLNPPMVIRREERGAASLLARLSAARQAAEAGFRLAFHFDPLLFFPGWQEAYRRTVEQLAKAVPPRKIAWISLGALRFMPALRQVILVRFPRSRLAAEEMVLAPDGKLRYFKDLRVEMFSLLKEWLNEILPGVFLYLCMESPRVWQEVFGFRPEGGLLAKLLDERAMTKTG